MTTPAPRPTPDTAATSQQADAPREFPIRRGCPFAPPAEYGTMRGDDPVARITLPTGREAWAVTRYDDVRELLSDPRVSADIRHPNFPALGEGEQEAGARFRPFIRTDAPEHTRYRRMLLPVFTVRRVRAMRPAVQACVDDILDGVLAAGGPVDFVSAYANAVSTSVICELLGIPKENLEFFRDVTRISGSRHSTAEEVAHALGGLFGLLSRLIGERRDEPRDDLISQLVTGHLATGKVTEDELLSTLGITINAGRETTTSMIALSTLLLLEQPELAAELRQDPALMPAAVDELLRILSVADSIPLRVAAEDIELSGRTIPAGDGVIALLAAADHDPEQFDTPGQADFHRTDNHHLAFGHGVHQCIGQHLARLELEVALETLLRRVPGLRLAGDREQVAIKHDSATFGLEELMVTW
ncbi:cytochrome P450 [Streptomyces sp. NPDC058045]|uniref:cytochrome P450 n=1 Tax=Streptomyces sp. NPDC058045 TaxID=3346311 RepID=UPI0036E6426D